MTLRDVHFWQVVLMIPAVTAIPVLYHLRQRWWHDWYGRGFMTLAMGLMLLANFAVTFRIIPDFPGKDWIKFAIYMVLLIAFYTMVILMWRTPSGRSRQ